ncbi:MAG: winged helix-turn-helix transcriptional regulator [Proteobacteria bacterium]|nr:winged helix-turn-helix transcriptional regulator [Pseudomonadota bacterium]
MCAPEAICALEALAQETRLAAFRLLVRQGARGLNVGALAGRLEVNPSTLSRHMAQLEAAGLVTAERDGRQMVYRADFCGMRGLVRFLLEDCWRGDIRPGWWPGSELGLIGDSIYLTDQ